MRGFVLVSHFENGAATRRFSFLGDRRLSGGERRDRLIVSKKAQHKTPSQPLIVPPTTPRNPIATHPLLKKSGAHGDQRRKAMTDAATSEIALAKKRSRKNDASDL
jgi:hypothetical protein